MIGLSIMSGKAGVLFRESFIQTADSFRMRQSFINGFWMAHWIFGSTDSFKTLNHSVMKTRLSVTVRQNGYAVIFVWIGTIFAAKMEQKQSIFSLKCKWQYKLLSYEISHFQSWWYSALVVEWLTVSCYKYKNWIFITIC